MSKTPSSSLLQLQPGDWSAHKEQRYSQPSSLGHSLGACCLILFLKKTKLNISQESRQNFLCTFNSPACYLMLTKSQGIKGVLSFFKLPSHGRRVEERWSWEVCFSRNEISSLLNSLLRGCQFFDGGTVPPVTRSRIDCSVMTCDSLPVAFFSPYIHCPNNNKESTLPVLHCLLEVFLYCKPFSLSLYILQQKGIFYVFSAEFPTSFYWMEITIHANLVIVERMTTRISEKRISQCGKCSSIRRDYQSKNENKRIKNWVWT